MLRFFFSHGERLSKALAFRLVHERWLTRALQSGRHFPRIPLRRVDQGGFDALRARDSGRGHAERWWMLALDRVDDPDDQPRRGRPR